MPTFNDARVRHANDLPIAKTGKYVLYWMQMTRRLHENHALDYAIHCAITLKKPLVVYEGLKLNYPWANARHHTFILQGIRDNAATAEQLGINYWPFVETSHESGHGLVAKLAKYACLLVTDDYPAYMIPAQNRAISTKASVGVHLIDGNCLVPLSLLGPEVKAAAHLRPRIHRLFAEAWGHRAKAELDLPKALRTRVEPPFTLWHPGSGINAIADFVAGLPLDQTVPPIPDISGGTAAGREALATFVRDKLPHYAEARNAPDDPVETASSRLSPYLHYGHLAIQEVAEAVFDSIPNWTPLELNPIQKGKREGFYSRDANANGFLDEAITWRDVGYQWHYFRNADCEASGHAKTRSWEDSEKTPLFNFESFDFSPSGDKSLDSRAAGMGEGYAKQAPHRPPRPSLHPRSVRERQYAR